MLDVLKFAVAFVLHGLVNDGLWVAMWLAACGLVAHVARTHGRGNARWFYLSALLLSPIFGLLIVLVLPNLRRERIEDERHQQILQALAVNGREQQMRALLVGDRI
jgi:hypothetical protein